MIPAWVTCDKCKGKEGYAGIDIEICEVCYPKKRSSFRFCKKCHRQVHADMQLSMECPPPTFDVLAENLQFIAVVDSKVVLSEKEVEIFSKLLKNGENVKSQCGAFDMYWSTSITDIKVDATKKVGAVLYESHSWSDSGGGIGMSVYAKVQYEDVAYTTDVMQFRDSRSASRDAPHLFADSILAVRIVQYEGSERYAKLKLGPQRKYERWEEARIPKKESA